MLTRWVNLFGTSSLTNICLSVRLLICSPIYFNISLHCWCISELTHKSKTIKKNKCHTCSSGIQNRIFIYNIIVEKYFQVMKGESETTAGS